MKKTETPPKTRIAFHVCITGHRTLPDADLELLRHQIEQVLKEIDRHVKQLTGEIKPLHTGDPCILRLFSMLAEGSDRITAECALALGYRLQCPLPMKREEYARDFTTSESKDEFARLLSQAESVLEIEAGSKLRSRTYQDCGQVMLAQSDLLIAIWDGQDSGKIGGTSDMIEHARQHDIPVIWIHSASGHDIKFLYGDRTQNDWIKETDAVVRNILHPWHNNTQSMFIPENYMNENCSNLRQRKFYSRLIRLLSYTRKKKKSQSEPPVELPTDSFYEEHFLRHYECADQLAKYYRDIYRLCGVLRQLLPFIASVGLAIGFYTSLVGGPHGAPPNVAAVLNVFSNIGFLIQPLCFLLIILLSKIEKKHHWHQKFTDYRALSELLRHMEYLAPAGLVIRGLRVPAFNQNVNLSWVNWQFRAIVREAGLPSRRVDTQRIKDSYSYLSRNVIEGQIRYHEANRDKMQLITGRLEKFGMAVYYVGIIIVALRMGARYLTSGSLLPLDSSQKNYVASFFNMLSMVIPLFSALAFGISSQEGFARIGQLSSGMQEDLLNIQNRLENVKELDFNEYKKLSQYAADLMLSEFSDWNVFIKSKLISDH